MKVEWDDWNELVHVWIESVDVHDTFFIDNTATFRSGGTIVAVGLLGVASVVQGGQCLRTLSDHIRRGRR